MRKVEGDFVLLGSLNSENRFFIFKFCFEYCKKEGNYNKNWVATFQPDLKFYFYILESSTCLNSAFCVAHIFQRVILIFLSSFELLNNSGKSQFEYESQRKLKEKSINGKKKFINVLGQSNLSCVLFDEPILRMIQQIHVEMF